MLTLLKAFYIENISNVR